MSGILTASHRSKALCSSKDSASKCLCYLSEWLAVTSKAGILKQRQFSQSNRSGGHSCHSSCLFRNQLSSSKYLSLCVSIQISIQILKGDYSSPKAPFIESKNPTLTKYEVYIIYKETAAAFARSDLKVHLVQHPRTTWRQQVFCIICPSNWNHYSM